MSYELQKFLNSMYLFPQHFCQHLVGLSLIWPVQSGEVLLLYMFFLSVTKRMLSVSSGFPIKAFGAVLLSFLQSCFHPTFSFCLTKLVVRRLLFVQLLACSIRVGSWKSTLSSCLSSACENETVASSFSPSCHNSKADSLWPDISFDWPVIRMKCYFLW